jgi:hypothetical protein
VSVEETLASEAWNLEEFSEADVLLAREAFMMFEDDLVSDA